MVADCMALLRAMKLCAKLGYDRVVFEGDAQIVVTAANALKENPAWYGTLIKDTKALLNQNHLWQVSFIHRKGNQAAHEMAKIGTKSILLQKLWFYDFPYNLLQAHVQDMTV